jgi:Mrp family chromosome partitioning ATPase
MTTPDHPAAVTLDVGNARGEFAGRGKDVTSRGVTPTRSSCQDPDGPFCINDRMRDNPAGVLIVISGLPGEGKTAVAAGLAARLNAAVHLSIDRCLLVSKGECLLSR